MVRMLAALLLVAGALPALAAPAYRAEPDTVALGEPIMLTITAGQDRLKNLDLAPLAKDFEIRDLSQGSDGKEANLSLTLYPLRTGRIVLPGFDLRLRAPIITVTEQSENLPRVRFLVETAPQQFHVREPIRFTIEVCDDGSLMWQRPQLATQEGLHLRALNQEQVEVEREGERCTAHRWHWAVQAMVAGVNELPLPMLEASKFGQRLRFPPPQAKLNALPVPNWLPAEASVGRPEISASAIPPQWAIGRPLTWRFEVSGGYSAEALKSLLRLQLANLPQFSDYPPTIEALASNSGVPRHAVSVYAVFGKRGNVRLPDLLLPWYDPASGRLQQVQIKGASVEVVDPARQRLLAWLLGLAGLLAVLLTGYLLWGMLAWRWRRHRALDELRRVTELPDMVRLLCAFSLRAKALPAATLGEWQQRMRQEETQMRGLAGLVAAVEAAHYGETWTELSSLREAALACIGSARPKPYFFKA